MSKHRPPEPAALLAASFHRERVAARRLSRSEALSPALALQRILEGSAAAAAMPLADFLGARHRESEARLQRQTERRAAARLRHLARLTTQASDPTAWQVWFDGSAVPNPGRLGLGVLLQAPDGCLHRCSIDAGSGNSNDAEYLALILALEQALAMRPATLVVHGDSRIVIDDVLGRLPPVAALQAHRLHAQALLTQFAAIRLAWVPRARNAAADALARAALLPVASDDRSAAQVNSAASV